MNETAQPAAATAPAAPRAAYRPSVVPGLVANGPGSGVAKEVEHILPQQRHLANQKVREFFVIAPADSVPVDFHLRPGPFELVARDMAMYANVRIVHPSGLWMADGIVVDHLPPAFVLVHIVRSFNLAPRKSDDSDRVPAGYTIRQGGPGEDHTWLVYRDGKDEEAAVLLSYGQFLRSKNDAVSFLLAHNTLTQNATRNAPTYG